MPATYTLIASNTLSSTATSVVFSDIPQIYTDLVLRISPRLGNAGADDWTIRPNGSNLNGSVTRVYYNGSGGSAVATSDRGTSLVFGTTPGTAVTSNTFGSSEVYIPNYTGTTTKPISSISVMENNASVYAFIYASAGFYNNTTALTSLSILSGGSQFVSGSSFFLYGIKNS